MDSYQYRVFKERYPFLQEGIKPAVTQLARVLYSKNIIPRITDETTNLASELLKALDSQIKTEPNSLYDFMAVLRSMRTLRHLFRDLNERLPDHLQPQFLEDPPNEEQEETDGGPFFALPISTLQAANPATPVYILQPVHSLSPSTVTGSMQVFPPTAIPVYNGPPQVLRTASFDIDELTSHVPKHILARQCEDVVLSTIANEMNHYDTLFVYFGLSRVKMDDIIRKYPHSPQRQRQDLLFEWRDMVGRRATYKLLMNCFCQAKRQDLVNFTCEFLDRHYCAGIGGSSNVNEMVASPENEALAVSTERAAGPLPRRPPPHDPSPPTIPFQDQHSEPQSFASPSNGLAAGDTSTERPNQAPSSLPASSGPRQPAASDQVTALTSISHSSATVEDSYSYLRTSSGDSFHTARSHTPSQSSVEISDDETSDSEELQRDLDKIAKLCSNHISSREKQVKDLKRKVRERNKELETLQERLAQKERELASRTAQETQPLIDKLKKELEITRDYAAVVDQERRELARECLEVQSKLETYRSQNRGLHKEVMGLRCQLFQSQQEAFECGKEKAQLAARIKELESSMEFFFLNSNASCRTRSQSF